MMLLMPDHLFICTTQELVTSMTCNFVTTVIEGLDMHITMHYTVSGIT